jgi:hypothetical protein
MTFDQALQKFDRLYGMHARKELRGYARVLRSRGTTQAETRAELERAANAFRVAWAEMRRWIWREHVSIGAGFADPPFRQAPQRLQ